MYTAPELLEKRYKSPLLRYVAGLLSLFALIGILAAQVWACSAIFEILGVDPTLAAIVATSVFIIYTAMSGLWAAVLTDLLQIILGTVGVVIATVVAWFQIGSWENLTTRLNELQATGILTESANYYTQLGSPGISLIGLTIFATVMYTMIGQDFYQRLFAAKDPQTSLKGSIIGAACFYVCWRWFLHSRVFLLWFFQKILR